MSRRRRIATGLLMMLHVGFSSTAWGQPEPDVPAPADLVAAWVDAEDRGDPRGYAELFDASFASSTGPDARGPSRLGGWLAGVAPRFLARARIEADPGDVVRLSGAAAARVRRVRVTGDESSESVSWLWLVPSPAGWRIAALEEVEERRSRRRKPSDPADLPIRPVVLAGRPYVVLSRALPEQVSGDRTPDLIEQEAGWQVRTADDLRDEPGVQRWLGRSVTLHDAAGPVCRGTTQAVVVLAKEPGSSSSTDPASAAFDLARLWADAPGGAAAVVALTVAEVASGDCPGALWVHRDDAAPERVSPAEVPAALVPRALAALRKLPTFRAAARRLRDEMPPTSGPSGRRARSPAWDREPDAHVDVRGFGPGPAGVSYLALSACSARAPHVGASAVWQVIGDTPETAHLLLLSDPDQPARAFLPEVAVTWSGARDPIFLDAVRLFAIEGTRLRPRCDLSPPLYARPLRGGSTTGVASATLGPRPPPTPGADAAGRAPHERTPRSP